ncbi:MAG: type II 3-dehydroquinate dehydratase [Chitinophagales bacterium]
MHCLLFMAKKKIIIINGPNLNLLGKREPHLYGSQDFESYFNDLIESYPDLDLYYYQSNIEGELIDMLQEVGFSYEGIILNAGGYTHTSVALADAVAAIDAPVIEVHITNPYAREEVRRKSLLSQYAIALIAGFGLQGYRYALEYFDR